MFKKVNVPVLGIVENMSYFQCPKLRARDPIFFGHMAGRGSRRKKPRRARSSARCRCTCRFAATSDAGHAGRRTGEPDGPHAAIYRAHRPKKSASNFRGLLLRPEAVSKPHATLV